MSSDTLHSVEYVVFFSHIFSVWQKILSYFALCRRSVTAHICDFYIVFFLINFVFLIKGVNHHFKFNLLSVNYMNSTVMGRILRGIRKIIQWAIWGAKNSVSEYFDGVSSEKYLTHIKRVLTEICTIRRKIRRSKNRPNKISNRSIFLNLGRMNVIWVGKSVAHRGRIRVTSGIWRDKNAENEVREEQCRLLDYLVIVHRNMTLETSKDKWKRIAMVKSNGTIIDSWSIAEKVNNKESQRHGKKYAWKESQ